MQLANGNIIVFLQATTYERQVLGIKGSLKVWLNSKGEIIKVLLSEQLVKFLVSKGLFGIISIMPMEFPWGKANRTTRKKKYFWMLKEMREHKKRKTT